jgi:hypothetical protein
MTVYSVRNKKISYIIFELLVSNQLEGKSIIMSDSTVKSLADGSLNEMQKQS